MPKVQTVKVKHGNGFKIINAADFDGDTMTKYGEPDKKAEAPKPKRRGRTKKSDS